MLYHLIIFKDSRQTSSIVQPYKRDRGLKYYCNLGIGSAADKGGIILD
jgi:hypothetical protein